MFDAMRESKDKLVREQPEPLIRKADSIQITQRKLTTLRSSEGMPESRQEDSASKLGPQILREIPSEESKAGTVLYGGMTRH